jgi:hypothetical protein
MVGCSLDAVRVSTSAVRISTSGIAKAVRSRRTLPRVAVFQLQRGIAGSPSTWHRWLTVDGSAAA